MAVPMGKPATSFNAQNRKWVEDMLDGGGGSGGSGLPDITEQDEGKVLKVDTGEAVWATPTECTLVVHAEAGVMDKTWNEINTALQYGKFVTLLIEDSGGYLQLIIIKTYEDGGYCVGFLDDSILYVADTEDGYPEAD